MDPYDELVKAYDKLVEEMEPTMNARTELAAIRLLAMLIENSINNKNEHLEQRLRLLKQSVERLNESLKEQNDSNQ